MDAIYNSIQSADNLGDNDKYYWGYQYRLASEILVPMLKTQKAFSEGIKVVEIGCGEGGVLNAFVEAGAGIAMGTDISEPRIEAARKIALISGQEIEYNIHDIIGGDIKEEWFGSADLVLLRDVIEHLDDTETALINILKIMKSSGKLFVTFPPYYSPYGGHQQILMNKWGKLPYIHLLPRKLFFKLSESGRERDVAEVKRLNNIRMTANKFINAAEKAGLKIIDRKYYLLRPVFKMKFGLPTINITPIAKLNFIRDFFSLEASYLLEK